MGRPENIEIFQETERLCNEDERLKIALLESKKRPEGYLGKR